MPDRYVDIFQGRVPRTTLAKHYTGSGRAREMEDSESYLDLKIVTSEIYIKGKFYRRGNLFDVRQDGTFVLNKIVFLSGNTIEDCKVGIGIG